MTPHVTMQNVSKNYFLEVSIDFTWLLKVFMEKKHIHVWITLKIFI